MKTRTLQAMMAVALISMSGASLANDNAYRDRPPCSTPGCTHHHERDGKVVLRSDKIYPPIGPYSQMVAFGNLVFFSGFAPLNLAGTAIEGTTIEDQTKVVLDYIGAGLDSQGLTFDDVLSVTVYMKDLNEFAAMNRIYAGYFRRDPPARATIQAARLPRDAKIEISIIAGRR
jgi:reactive intermediate/imine deaminase